MRKNEMIETDALTEIMNPSVSTSADRDAEIKKGIEKVLADFSPKDSVHNSAVMDEENVDEAETSIQTPASIQRRVSSKQSKLSLEEYRNTFLKVPTITDRKPVFLSGEVRDRLDDYVHKLGGRKMSVSGLLENIARQHLDAYDADFEQWRKL